MPKDIYGVFCYPIDQNSIQRLMHNINVATQQKAERVHILFQSTGGSVPDGICLYNFLKGAPIKVILYNVGTIASIATLAFLAAQERIASRFATFMIHRVTSPVLPLTVDAHHAMRKPLELDDSRVLEIMRLHMTIKEDDWNNLGNNQLWLTAKQALEDKFVDKIGDFAPPKGTMLYTF